MGRIASGSVIHCSESKQAINSAINLALSDSFRSKLEKFNNPYGIGGASEQIAQILNQTCLNQLIQKQFYDLPN